ncbi:MAG: EamA family transporter [Alphaproteobacteria bacterium]|nr:EamA family transporter [Alphaproteobacteria bacterium]
MLPHLALTVAAALWSSAFVASKAAVATIPVGELCFVRFAIGALCLWLVALPTGQMRGMGQVAGRAFATGLFEPGFITVIVYWGLAKTSAVHGVVIFALMPLVTAFLGRLFLRESLNPFLFAGSIFAMGGTVLLVTGTASGGEATLAGDAIVAFGLFLACVAILVLRRVTQAPVSPIALTATQMTGAAAAGLAVALIESGGAFEWVTDAGPETFAILAYLGVLVSGVAFVFYNIGLRHIEAARVSLYIVLITPLGVPLAAFVLGEAVTLRDAFAVALVVAGVALPALVDLNRYRRTRPGRDALDTPAS